MAPRLFVILSLVVSSATLTGCKASSSSTSRKPAPTSSSVADGGTRVALLDTELVFSPARVVIHRGAEVTWRWPGGTAHNVTFEDFGSGTFTTGTFNHVFYEPGSFKYQCTLHTADGKGMTGEVVVLS